MHTNGNFTNNQGNPTVTGPVSESGSGALDTGNYLGGSVTRTAPQSIPFISAREVWGRQSHNAFNNLQATWYDLCQDGSVHLVDGNTTSPCTGPLASNGDAATVASQGFRGWTHGSVSGVSTWYAGSGLKNNGYSGIYYIDRGDAIDNASNSGSPVPNLTVLASSVSLDCNKTGGNISWSQTDAAAPALTGTFLFADQDLQVTHNVSFGRSLRNTKRSWFARSHSSPSMVRAYAE